MITAQGLIKLGFTPEVDFSLRDDGQGVYIYEWNTDAVQPSEELIEQAHNEAQVEWDSQEYARQRKAEYDKLNQFEMQFNDQRDGTTTWVDAINDIKAQFPKGGN